MPLFDSRQQPLSDSERSDGNRIALRLRQAAATARQSVRPSHSVPMMSSSTQVQFCCRFSSTTESAGGDESMLCDSSPAEVISRVKRRRRSAIRYGCSRPSSRVRGWCSRRRAGPT